MNRHIIKLTALYILLLTISTACYKIPKEGTISDQMQFSLKQVDLTPGRLQIIGEGYGLKVNIASTTIPFRFEVERVFKVDGKGEKGEDVTALFKKEIDTREWTGQYTGKEKTREELDAKRKTIKHAILSFTGANELVFNYGSPEITTGKYWLDVRVSNSSGFKILEKKLMLNVKPNAPTFLQVSKPTSGLDVLTECNVDLVKTGNGNSLTVSVVEKDGTVIPLDSLSAGSLATSFDNLLNFKKDKFEDKTVYDVEYPLPFVPSYVYYPYSAGRTQRVLYSRYATILNGAGEPVRTLRYSFTFYCGISEKGDWVLTVHLK